MTKGDARSSALVVAMAFLTAASVSADASAQKRSGHTVQRMAGTYLAETVAEVAPGVTLPPILGLFTFGSDGTLVSEDTSDFGVFSGVNGVFFESSNRGTWRRVGRYGLIFNAIGFAYAEDGSLVAIGRLRGKAVFNRDFTGFQSTGVHELLAPTDDPLDPDAVPVASVTFNGTGRRVPAHMD